MLLFIADEPTAENEKDGMIQRVKWVDEKFIDHPRTILSISHKGNLRRETVVRSENLTVERVNMFLHLPRILKLAFQSDAIYVHSCFHAFRILPLYFLGCRIVTDLHGVVPEEMQMRGNFKLARFFSLVERVVLRRSQAVVCVTNSMRDHFLRKYRRIPTAFVVPILTAANARAESNRRNERLVIYSGGVQRWQLVDEMIDATKSAKGDHEYLFLTGTPEKLKEELARRGAKNVQVSSVPRSRVDEVYSRASLGFVLRDESVVNKVACPTKLTEYLSFGVIPIVKNREIGDFNEIGYKFVDVADFEKGNLPSNAELETMRLHNLGVIQELLTRASREIEDLISFCLFSDGNTRSVIAAKS